MNRRIRTPAMGSSRPVLTALNSLLRQRDIKIAPRTLKSIVKEVVAIATWFAVSGSLTIPSWNKLGSDLDRKAETGGLRLGTKAIWKNCLEDEACHPTVKEGTIILEQVQDNMSETECSERLGAR